MKLIELLTRSIMKLPGIGPRSARKVVFFLLNNRDSALKPIVDQLKNVYDSIKLCENCGNFDDTNPCHLCTDEAKDHILCIVKEHTDLHSIEATKLFKGRYHILGANFAPSAKNAREIVQKVKDRITTEKFEEVILAMHPSVDGRIILHYLELSLKELGCKLTHLGLGIPIGSDFEYIDSETMSFAFRNRIEVK